jgi:hypothetical protein
VGDAGIVAGRHHAVVGDELLITLQLIARTSSLPIDVDARKATPQQIGLIKSVGGDLYLHGTKITELPDNLSVGGDLYLHGTKITELPDNLSVGGDLDLSGTPITTLPDRIRSRVKGQIFYGR